MQIVVRIILPKGVRVVAVTELTDKSVALNSPLPTNDKRFN